VGVMVLMYRPGFLSVLYIRNALRHPEGNRKVLLYRLFLWVRHYLLAADELVPRIAEANVVAALAAVGGVLAVPVDLVAARIAVRHVPITHTNEEIGVDVVDTTATVDRVVSAALEEYLVLTGTLDGGRVSHARQGCSQQQ
jgi:hypothetical protein